MENKVTAFFISTSIFSNFAMYYTLSSRTSYKRRFFRNRIPDNDPRVPISNWIYLSLRAGITVLAEEVYLSTFVFEILFSPPNFSAPGSPFIRISSIEIFHFSFFFAPCPEKQKHSPAKIPFFASRVASRGPKYVVPEEMDKIKNVEERGYLRIFRLEAVGETFFLLLNSRYFFLKSYQTIIFISILLFSRRRRYKTLIDIMLLI